VFYARRGSSDEIYTPPAADVLEGITRRTLIAALSESGVRTIERPLRVSDALSGEFALAVTSTSSRVIAVRTLFEGPGPGLAVERSPELDRVRAVYDGYLERYAARTR
jgi:branched-subunit amino acid aminotransferase/4-amino-4-deoxychorismate lyase